MVFLGSSAPHPCSHLRSSHLIPTHPLWHHPPRSLPDKSSVKVPRRRLQRHLHMLSLLAALHVSEQLHCCNPQLAFCSLPTCAPIPSRKGQGLPAGLGTPGCSLQPPRAGSPCWPAAARSLPALGDSQQLISKKTPLQRHNSCQPPGRPATQEGHSVTRLELSSPDPTASTERAEPCLPP